ncbi:hypothetical protein KGO95_02590 [Patescibacteria group bacterium]|nr:hypothetical protein [Patescibacteria group bacterium]
MRFAAPSIVKDQYLAPAFATAAVLWIAAFSYAYVNTLGAANVLAVHFDAFKGVDFFGGRGDIFNIMIIAAIVWAINAVLCELLYRREKFLSYAIAGATLLYMVLIFLAVGAIISII